MVAKRKKAEGEAPKARRDTKARIAKVIDMDAKLKEIEPSTGLTVFQQYIRDKIKNATKEA